MVPIYMTFSMAQFIGPMLMVVVDEKETIPVLKPSIKADESDAVNAIQVGFPFAS